MRWISDIEDRAPALLVAAAALVGVAIALDGVASRAVNGVAGIAWIVVAVALARRTLASVNGRNVLAGSLAIAFVLVLGVRPSDVLLAGVGFAVGGGIVALAFRLADARSALLLPAVWLPVHLGTALAKALYRVLTDAPANVRTDPPPTAALVPVTMVVAAYAGAMAVESLRGRRAARGTVAAAVER